MEATTGSQREAERTGPSPAAIAAMGADPVLPAFETFEAIANPFIVHRGHRWPEATHPFV
jgi:hypothetical protein